MGKTRIGEAGESVRGLADDLDDHGPHARRVAVVGLVGPLLPLPLALVLAVLALRRAVVLFDSDWGGQGGVMRRVGTMGVKEDERLTANDDVPGAFVLVLFRVVRLDNVVETEVD